MNVEFPFNYVNILLFSTLYQYENKRCFKVSELKGYYQVLLEAVVDNYHRRMNLFKKDEWDSEPNFYVNDKDNLDNFLVEHSNFFHLEGDTIYLNDEVEISDLNALESYYRKSENISTKFLFQSTNKKVLEYLKINKIYNILKRYILLEKKLENAYLKLDEMDNKDEIRKMLFMRQIFLNNLFHSESYVLTAFNNEARHLETQNTEEYIKYPVDMELWIKYAKKLGFDKEQAIVEIDDKVYERFQNAIFNDKSSLTYIKLCDMLESMFFGSPDESDNESTCELDENDNESTCELDEMTFDEDDLPDLSDGEYMCKILDYEKIYNTFYLLYIDELDKYCQKYGESENLKLVKKRLLYALDMANMCLFEKDRLTDMIAEAKNVTLDPKEDFVYVEDEARFLAQEVFLSKKDENTIKKLLFLKVYYMLTKDKIIVKNVRKFSKNENFELYSSLIFEDGKIVTKKFFKRD